MMDVAVPSDQNISLKEFYKSSKYKDLEIKISKIWKLKRKTEVLGMIKKGTQNLFDQMSGKPSIQEMQKIVLTGSAHIL